MALQISGKVLGSKNIGIPYFKTELWGSDQQNNLVGNTPITTSTANAYGKFRLTLASDIDLPTNTVLVFRDKSNAEIGRIATTPSILAGESVTFANSLISPPTFLGIWPYAYEPIQQITQSEESSLTLNPNEGLPLLSAPLDTYFVSYTYLDNYWPWSFQSNTSDQEERPLSRHYLLGVQLTHRQRWLLKGYARGELLNSFPLAPGEEASVEILSWDRNVVRRDDEITDDMDRQVEQNRVVKDSQELMREIESTKKWRVSGGFGLNIKIFNFGTSAEGEGTAKSIDKSTVDTIRETTDKTSLKVRSQRKTVVSSTKEFGSETKVTRKISNSNRCRTVTHHFYEVLSSYKLLTALSNVRPVIFVKLTPPFLNFDPITNSWVPITRQDFLIEPCDSQKFLEVVRWLDIHSHLISRGLLDRSFFSGIEALKELSGYWTCLDESSQEVSSIRKHAGYVVDSATCLNDISDMFLACSTNLKSKECRNARTKYGDTERDYLDYAEKYERISASWSRLTARLTWFEEWVLSGNPNSGVTSIAEALQSGTDLELKSVLQGFRDLWNGEEGYNSKTSVDDKTVIQGNALASGLLDAISRLLGALDNSGSVNSSTTSNSGAKISGISQESIAAIVRLMRHIARHFHYYCQLIWADQDADERLIEFDNIPLPGAEPPVYLADAIENDHLGFYGDFAVFPFKLEIVVSDNDDNSQQTATTLANAISEFNGLIVPEDKLEELAKPSWVVLPTNGIVVEPQLGEFNACDPFIQEHQLHDLELKSLEVKKAALENQRRFKKIETCELDNPDCCPSNKYGLFSKFLCYLRDKIG